MSDVTNRMKELLELLISNEDIIRPVAPELWVDLNTLSENTNWILNSVNQCWLLLAGEVVRFNHYARDAADQLKYAQAKMEKVNEIVDSNITPILEDIEDLQFSSRQNASEDEVKTFLDGVTQIRLHVESAKAELEMFYEEILQEVLCCVKEREGADIRGCVSGVVGVGSAAIVLASGLSTTQLTLSSQSKIGLVVASTISFLWFARNRSVVNNYNKAINLLDRARLTVLRDKIRVAAFLTHTEVLYIFKRLYTDQELIKHFEALITDLRGAFKKP